MSSPNLEETNKFNSQTRRKTFDNHLSYRICDGLRNYAQHRALPLSGFSIGGQTNHGQDSTGKTINLDTGFNVSPWLNVPKFKSSSQCKATLRKELESLGFDKIDMTWLIRSLAGAMYERHATLRVFLKPKVATAGEEITAGYDFASAAKNSEARFLELCGNDEKRSMRKDLSNKVLKAFETCTSLARAERSYVTSQITNSASTYSG